MAGGPVKLFEFNQTYCQAIGIESPEPNRNKFKAKHMIYIIFETNFELALFGFLMYDAKSMGEYGVTFFAMISTANAVGLYFITFWKVEKISQFIEHFEAIIEKSKSNVVTKNVFFFTHNSVCRLISLHTKN